MQRHFSPLVCLAFTPPHLYILFQSFNFHSNTTSEHPHLKDRQPVERLLDSKSSLLQLKISPLYDAKWRWKMSEWELSDVCFNGIKKPGRYETADFFSFPPIELLCFVLWRFIVSLKLLLELWFTPDWTQDPASRQLPCCAIIWPHDANMQLRRKYNFVWLFYYCESFITEATCQKIIPDRGVTWPGDSEL